jgi:hypothetical protein
MLQNFLINIGASVIYDFGKAIKTTATKNETVQIVLKQLGASPNLHDFPDRYVEALVEFRFLEKEAVVMAFFREESIAQAFFNFYYGENNLQNNEDMLWRAINHCVEALKVGDDVKEKNVDVRSEVEQFWEVFKQKVNQSRSVKEVEVKHSLDALNDKIDIVIVKNTNKDTIQIEVDGKLKEIQNQLESFKSLLESLNSKSFQTADKIYNINSITNANFEYILGQANANFELPANIANELITDASPWLTSIKQAIQRQKVSVSNSPRHVFQHYGWLIEAYLLKMETKQGKERSSRSLSFMVGAFQSSLRYLCYIQIAQLLKHNKYVELSILEDFISFSSADYLTFDYLNLLILSTGELGRTNAFCPQIHHLVDELTDTSSDLYGTALFLDKNSRDFINNKLNFSDAVLDEYLTALVFWLRNLAFLAKYRLVSIKDIALRYRLGTAKTYLHIYGELHGIYDHATMDKGEYIEQAIEDLFTYNHSVLLFNGSNIESCLSNLANPNTYLSLSPLVIDRSVFLEKPTQTPSIFCYSGYTVREYKFQEYNNKVSLADSDSKKVLTIKRINTQTPKFDDFFEEMEKIFAPFKSLKS